MEIQRIGHQKDSKKGNADTEGIARWTKRWQKQEWDRESAWGRNGAEWYKGLV